ARELRGIDWRSKVQPDAEPQRETEAAQRVDRAGHAGRPRGASRDGDRSLRIRPQRARTRDAARSRRSTALAERNTHVDRRELGARDAWRRQGRDEEELRWRRGGEAMAG